MRAKEALLSAMPLFGGCEDAQLQRVAMVVDSVEAPAGTVLTEQGRVGHEVFVIIRGVAEVRVKGLLVAELGPGDVFGEVAILDPGPRTATVTAVSELQLFVFDPRGFVVLLSELPDVARRIMTMLSQRLRDLQSGVRMCCDDR